MLRFALPSPGKLLMAIAAAAFLSFAGAQLQAQPDPPAQAGRISYISGNVFIQPAGVDDWGQALPNLPIGPGDRVFTDYDGRAEIQVGQTFVRIGPNSDVSLVDSTAYGIYFGVGQGSIHLRTNGLWDGQSVYVNTPSGSSTLSGPGELRVDVMADEPSAMFTSFGTNLFITGAGGFGQGIGGGQALELIGSNPVYPQWLQPADWDDLDNWSNQRDRQIAQAMSYRYVSREIPGAYELDATGQWLPGTPYGAIWFPNNVPAGWAPYHYGHWVNHAPWGWVWVEDESWGYAPFHYGRWVSFSGRWGWVPGPPAAHPVWSPALVVFAGGVHVGGNSLSVWFPLGPGEPYRPWYPCSPRYIDTVNISNITPTPTVHVQTTYVNINVTNVTYVNRTIAVSAMNNADFASGRPVRQAAVVVDVQQMQHVQPLAAPEPRPTRTAMVAGPPPAHVLKVSAARPVLINERGKAVTATPGAKPMEPPVKPAPVVKPPVGHAVVAPPANAVKFQPPAAKGAPAAPPAAMHAPPPPAPAPVKPNVTAPPKPNAMEPAKEAPKAAPEKMTAPAKVAPKTAPEAAPKEPAAPRAIPPALEPKKPAPEAAAAPKTRPETPPPAKPDNTKDKNKDKKNDKDKDKEKKDNPGE